MLLAPSPGSPNGPQENSRLVNEEPYQAQMPIRAQGSQTKV